jgi:hypothetical protein
MAASEHDPEKWEPVLENNSVNNPERQWIYFEPITL